MTIEQIIELRSGNVVTWTDPDQGLCSKTATILDIAVHGNIIRLTLDDGSELEAYAEELS